MDRSEKTVLTNMCMIYDDDGNVLVQDRRDSDWGGITFPGGHVEKGLTIETPQICGIKQWPEDDGSRYIVLFYKTSHFAGELKSSEEGEVYWTKLSRLKDLPLARGMELMLRVFLEDEVSEYYIYEEDGEWKHVLK